jgi:anti-anti-sigma factor
MNITVNQVQGRVPVTILGLHGDLDASNFETVIATAQEVQTKGVQYLLIDMSDVPFMASSGLVALHSIAVFMRGEEAPDLEAGWSVFHAIERDQEMGLQPYVKLYNPQPTIDRTLKLSGLKEFFEVHTDLQTAIASF